MANVPTPPAPAPVPAPAPTPAPAPPPAPVYSPLAQVAYAAFVAGRKERTGRDFPPWEPLNDDEKYTWDKVAAAVLAAAATPAKPA